MKMTEAIFGLVTEVKSRESNGKVYNDVYVACGRRTVRTTGPDGGYVEGEYVAIGGNARLSRFEEGVIEFERDHRLTIAELAGYFPELKVTKAS